MASQVMTPVNLDSVQPNSGAVYNETVELTAEDTTEYKLPIKQIFSIAADIVGDATLWFTISSPADIDAGNGVYYVWDGVSNINFGVTGFKMVWGSGTATVTVTVKTFNS